MLIEEKEQKPINTNAITRHNVIIFLISSCGDIVSASFQTGLQIFNKSQ